ncbi:MAG: calcium/sodium antiporter [Phycisphaerae bacterium]
MTFTLSFLGGLAFLLIGGRLLVSASVDAARRLSVSALVVGLTLVAWGTSAPELALNLVSAWKQRGDLALGNVVGANICNIGMVLGVCALVRPLQVQERLIRVEIWLNAAFLFVMAALGISSGFQRWEAGLMLCTFGAYSAWTIIAASRESRELSAREAAEVLGPDPTGSGPPMSWFMIASCFAGGLALLSLGGSFASDGASGMALALGVPSAIVGVTIVSIGTTLPEMITSVLAVRKGQTDLAVGNVLGSCLFNAGAIFGLTGLIAPPAQNSAFALPLSYMAVLALALIPISRTFGKTVARVEGALLVASYIGFLAASAITAIRG